MKKLILLLIAVIFALLIYDYASDNNSTQSALNTANHNNTKAIDIIKSETKVKEALITDSNVLYVSVLDDGTKRDGYASYLCEILKESNSSVNRVKIVKVNSTTDPKRDNAYGILLGEAWCK